MQISMIDLGLLTLVQRQQKREIKGDGSHRSRRDRPSHAAELLSARKETGNSVRGFIAEVGINRQLETKEGNWIKVWRFSFPSSLIFTTFMGFYRRQIPGVPDHSQPGVG